LRFILFSEYIWKYVITIASDKYYPIWKVRSFFQSLVFTRHPDDFEVIIYLKNYKNSVYITDKLTIFEI
jgi:hypothetical protein